MKTFMLFIILSFCLGAWASSCTDACDAFAAAASSSLYTGNVTFCGTDFITYNTLRAAINSFTSPGCYAANCSIGLVYPGTCGCPNHCNADFGRGTCDSINDTCKCTIGWGGKDCSNVACPANNCSGHGVCVAQSAKKGGDMCQCNDGWTSADCSVPVPAELANRLPYGQIFPGDYYKNDKYGDDQPVINASLVSTIRLTIDPQSLAYVLNPANMYNLSDTPCDFFFFNAYTSQTIKNITVELHGSLSRVFNKKSFNLKFGKGNSYKKLKGLTLKASNFDRIVSYQMMGEFHRAMMSQTYRMSMAELWVNGVFYGMYSILEKINDDYEQSRYNVSQDTDMFKMSVYDAQNLGNTAEPYQDLLTPIYKTPQNCISKEEGSDDSWDKFVQFIEEINAVSSTERASYLNQHFDVTAFLRSIALEAITMDFDGYSGTGNNWIITDRSTHPATSPVWEWSAFDYDAPIDGLNLFQTVIAASLGTTPAVLNAYIDAGIVVLPNSLGDYFLSQNPYKFVNRPEHPKPLLLAVFALAGSNQTYTNNIRAFLKAVFVQNKLALNQRFLDYYSLARPGLSRDYFYGIDGSTMALYDTSAGATLTLLNSRFTYLLNLVGCASTVTWQQTLQSSWSDGRQNFSQWAVTLHVGAESLYSTQFSIAPTPGNTIQNIWSADTVSAGVYAVPTWVYQNGVLPAHTSTYSFGYIATGTQSAAIKITNEACSPPSGCSATVTPSKQSSWQSGALYQQYTLKVINTSQRPLANVNVDITLAAGSTIDSSYNLALVSSTSSTEFVYSCSAYNLAPGSTYTGCGYTIKTPQGTDSNTYATVALTQAVCV